MRLGLALFLWVSVVVQADPLHLKTDDVNEAPYQWDEVRCVLGKSDLSISSVKKAGQPGQVHFYFRNLSDFVQSLQSTQPMALNVTTTQTLGLSFEDRDQQTWAFQPKRNQATCALKLKKNEEGELILWGKCEKLLPKKKEDTFCQGIQIAESNPLKCKLEQGKPDLSPSQPASEAAKEN